MRCPRSFQFHAGRRQSSVGRAEGLSSFVNQAIEHCRSDFLFIGHPEAGQRSAVMYSVLSSCRRHGINPDEYFRDIFLRLPKAKISDLKILTPAAWTKVRRAAKPPTA